MKDFRSFWTATVRSCTNVHFAPTSVSWTSKLFFGDCLTMVGIILTNVQTATAGIHFISVILATIYNVRDVVILNTSAVDVMLTAVKNAGMKRMIMLL